MGGQRSGVLHDGGVTCRRCRGSISSRRQRKIFVRFGTPLSEHTMVIHGIFRPSHHHFVHDFFAVLDGHFGVEDVGKASKTFQNRCPVGHESFF